MGYNLMPKEAKGLARALFHEENELKMSLKEGYRGRPHVGSAALLLQIERSEFWRSLKKLVTESKEGEGVRIFLCGSAFGGTGAAILPTLARDLRRNSRQQGSSAANGWRSDGPLLHVRVTE